MCVYFYGTWFLFLVYSFCYNYMISYAPQTYIHRIRIQSGFSSSPTRANLPSFPLDTTHPHLHGLPTVLHDVFSDSCRIFLDHSHGYTRLGRGDCSLVSDTFRILVKSRIYFCSPRVFVTVQNMPNERLVLRKRTRQRKRISFTIRVFNQLFIIFF